MVKGGYKCLRINLSSKTGRRMLSLAVIARTSMIADVRNRPSIMWYFVSAVLVLLFAIKENHAAYVPPNAKVEPLYPKGLRMSIPHEDGITLVAYHIKFNEEFFSLEAGQIAIDIIKPRNGRWLYEDRTTTLKPGDTIYFWIHVVYQGLGYNLLDQSHVVKDFFNYDGTPVTSVEDRLKSCTTPSRTRIYGQSGEYISTCPGDLIFEDNFNTLNANRWRIVERFASAPDYEFVVYMNKEENVKVKDGVLEITPILTEQQYGDGFVRQGNLVLQKCTSDSGSPDCQRNALGSYILPPVISGRINSRNHFTFLYGRIEVRAKLPRGDWIYPLITLECIDDHAKDSFMFYEMRIACASGNAELTTPNGNDISGHVLSAGALEITVNHSQHQHTNRWSLPTKTSNELWSDNYHVYELEWHQHQIIAKVDGVQYGQQLLSASFDKPSYINFGLAVGGLGEFPDMSRSGSFVKPWRNIGSKALFNFYVAQNDWSRSWENGDPSIHIDYVKVWAL